MRTGTWLKALEWVPALLARLCVGPLYVASGWSKLQDLEKVAGYFGESLGLPFPGVMAVVVGGFELLCGSLLLLGLFVRPATVPLMAIMVVAVVKVKWPELEGLASLGEIPEVLYLPLLAYLGVYGGGAVSVDAARTQSPPRVREESTDWIPHTPTGSAA